MRRKQKNLQPWLDYFAMLRRYIDSGFLQMEPALHEAYVTRAALHAMTPGDNPSKQLSSGAVIDTARRIHTYAAFLSAHERGLHDFEESTVADPSVALPAIPVKDLQAYNNTSFALHVVAEDVRHEPLYTILLSPRRHWWQRHGKVEIIMMQ